MIQMDLCALLAGKKLLIFDFDGTVANTSALHAAAFARVLAPYGVDLDYGTIAGRRTLDAMRQLLTSAGKELPEEKISRLVYEKQAAVREMITSALVTLPGVDQLLRWARPKYRLAIVTSGSRRNVLLALEMLGYTGWFDPLICAEDVIRAKPDPEGFRLALRRADTTAEEAIVFEDAACGFEAAVAAGIQYLNAPVFLRQISTTFQPLAMEDRCWDRGTSNGR